MHVDGPLVMQLLQPSTGLSTVASMRSWSSTLPGQFQHLPHLLLGQPRLSCQHGPASTYMQCKCPLMLRGDTLFVKSPYYSSSEAGSLYKRLLCTLQVWALQAPDSRV